MKKWILRKMRPLIAEAAGPAVHAAAREALQELVPAAVAQAAGRSIASIAAAAQSAMKATGEAALPGLQRIESAEAEFLLKLEQVHARQLAALAEQARASLERVERLLSGQLAFTASHDALLEQLAREKEQQQAGYLPRLELGQQVRSVVRKHAGLPAQASGEEDAADLLTELQFLWTNSAFVRPMLQLCAGRRVLYPGQCYYNLWYLSRALRERGWTADVLNWDGNPASQIYYHGHDFRFCGAPDESLQVLRFYVDALYGYDVFHFSNAQGISFGGALTAAITDRFGEHGEIWLLKALGKKIVYTNNGCLDGVSQTAFSRWGPESVCSICRWQNEPSVCSDERNLRWGGFRNSVADYQCLLGGNRADFNDDPRVHEDPWVYCLDPEFWRPDLEIPDRFRLPRASERTLLLYHAVGHKSDRTRDDGVNIKSSHVYLPLIDKLRAQGWDVQLLEPEGVPNRDVRYLQLQADIFLEMLTYGWFGANAREAMMLGKPVICYIRPEWLESLREELPEYAEELPIVSATPDTIEEVLVDLMRDADKRAEIGRRGREFMLRWHSAPAAAAHFDEIYTRLLAGDPLLRPRQAPAIEGAMRLRRAHRT